LQFSLFALSLMTAFTGNAAAADPPRAQKQPEKSGELRPRITVSEKTTHILQPLDADGYVDYLAALNQMTSQGVTPENNAGVLFVRALGLNGFQPAYRARVFKLLQIEPFSEQGEYLTEFDEFVMKKRGRPPTKQEQADFDTAMQEPWSGSEFPLVAEWLTSNAKPIDLIIQGTRRPRCYFPMVESGHSGLVALPMLTVQMTRNAARALAARAMLRLGEGRIGEAEQDLLACHRLARLVGSAPFDIAAFLVVAIDSIACQGDARLMEQAHLSAEGALAYQRELRQLPSLPVMADVIDGSDRFVFLDTLLMFARGKRADFEKLIGSSADIQNLFQTEGAPRVPRVAKAIVAELHSNPSLLDWDAVLQFGNEQFDKAVTAARKATVPERKKAIEAFERELRAMRSGLTDLGASGTPSSAGRSLPNPLGREIGIVLTALFMPPVSTACEAENRARTRYALGQLGFALSAYRADHAAYPESLDVLAPKYIAQVPTDLYTEQPLRFKRQGDGFLLYSVGPNSTDDGGRTPGSQPPGDDIVLQIPHKNAKKK
jgi:hypothetical protein